MSHGSRTRRIHGLALLMLLAAGCAAGNDMYAHKPAGFWAGLWHGLICVVTFVIGLFSDGVRMYEINNSGGWYDFGFLLGALIILRGGRRWGKGRRRS